VNRLTGYLKALGHKVPKYAVAEYLEWLEDAYFLFSVHLFDPSAARRNTNPKTIYCIDHALVVSVWSGIRANRGRLLENLVFTALRRVTPEIHYVKTRRGAEVDFLARLPKGSRLLVQVCDDLADRATRTREIRALREAMEELDMPRGIVVTREHDEQVETGTGQIDVTPAWRFLL